MKNKYTQNLLDSFLHIKLLMSVFVVVATYGSAFVNANELSSSKIRVALFLDHGAHPRNNLRVALENAPDMSVSTINGDEIRHGYLQDFDLLIVPGGSSIQESISMKAEGRNEIRRFVQQGGLYIGICAGAYLLSEAKLSDLGLLPLDTVDKAHWRRGRGILPVELTPMGQEVFGTKMTTVHVLYHNGPVMDVSRVLSGTGFVPLGYYRGEISAKEGKQGVMINTPAMFMGRYGKGWVLGISPHPEADKDHVNMDLNAVRWLFAHREPSL